MNRFLNFVPEKLIHTNQRADGKQFFSISIPCAQSKTGYASIAVNAGQVFAATRGKDRTAVAGFKSVLLGDEAKLRKVSVATNKKGSAYKDIEMSNAEISDAFEASRAAYRAAREAAVATE